MADTTTNGDSFLPNLALSVLGGVISAMIVRSLTTVRTDAAIATVPYVEASSQERVVSDAVEERTKYISKG